MMSNTWQIALTADVAAYAASNWKVPCESMFDWLVDNHPGELVNLIESGTLEPSGLTFAAEALSEIKDHDTARRVLFGLLRHDTALVREGAIYGLSGHVNADVVERLRLMSESDPSPAIRECAREFYE